MANRCRLERARQSVSVRHCRGYQSVHLIYAIVGEESMCALRFCTIQRSLVATDDVIEMESS